MNRFSVSIALLCLASVVAPANAQDQAGPSYSRDDVVNALTKQQIELMATRSVCIGAKSKCVKQTAVQKGYDMLLTFEFDSSELTDAAKDNLDIISDALQDKKFNSLKFRIEGYTDAKGADDYNMTLSIARANSVVRYLESKNISAERLNPIGYGKKFPRSSDQYAAENRRVELKVQAE